MGMKATEKRRVAEPLSSPLRSTQQSVVALQTITPLHCTALHSTAENHSNIHPTYSTFHCGEQLERIIKSFFVKQIKWFCITCL